MKKLKYQTSPVVNNQNMEKITVYFDGSCYICRKQMEYYRKKDKNSLIRFVDIIEPGFDSEDL